MPVLTKSQYNAAEVINM